MNIPRLTPNLKDIVQESSELRELLQWFMELTHKENSLEISKIWAAMEGLNINQRTQSSDLALATTIDDMRRLFIEIESEMLSSERHMNQLILQKNVPFRGVDAIVHKIYLEIQKYIILTNLEKISNSVNKIIWPRNWISAQSLN